MHYEEEDQNLRFGELEIMIADEEAKAVSRTRAKIREFTQGRDESMYQAWTRLIDYTKEYLRHGYSDSSILASFYRGVFPKYKDLLDLASGGDFLENDVATRRSIVARLAMSDELFEEGNGGGTSNSGVHLRSNRTRNPSRDNRDIRTAMAEIKDLIDTVIATQARDKTELMELIDDTAKHLNTHIDNLSGRLTSLEDEVQTLRERLLLGGTRVETEEPSADPSRESMDEQVSDEEHVASEIPADTVHLYEGDEAWHAMSEASQRSLRPFEYYRKLTSTLDIMKGTVEERYLERTNQNFLARKESIQWKVYWIKVRDYACEPCHRPFTEKSPLQYKWENLEESGPLGLVPLTRGGSRCNSLAEFFGGRSAEMDSEVDPGKFTIACIIRDFPFLKCPLDTGLGKSLMPLKVCKRIGITIIDRLDPTLHVADLGTSQLVGIAKKVYVNFMGHMVATDFIVVDKGDDTFDQVILGRPFLFAIGARLDMMEGSIQLKTSIDNRERRIWKNPQYEAYGEPFDLSIAEFFLNLVERTDEIDEQSREVNCDETYEFDASFTRVEPVDVPWQTIDLEAYHGRGLAGVGEVYEDVSDGDEASPSDHELDPGDTRSNTPGNAPPS